MTRIFPTIAFIIIFFLPMAAIGHAESEKVPFSVAFYYASEHPLDELKAFDVVVVDPGSGISPSTYGTGKSELFAYVSLGEASPDRAYFSLMKQAWFMGTNKAWNTRITDVSNPEWRTFFIDRVVAPLWETGYRGLFLDTMDSYRLAAPTKDYSRMEDGIVATLTELRRRFPGMRLILNRGFEVFGRVKGDVFAVAAESLFRGYVQGAKAYGEVVEKDREWLLARFKEVQAAGVPVIAIDYVAPGKRELARQTAEQIRAHGIIPWVTDRDLGSLGVGAVEVMPRKILGLYDGAEGGGDAFFASLQRFAAMPLNYLGYSVELHDLRKPLPRGILAGRYAGILIWPISNSSGISQGLGEWVDSQVEQGMKVVFLDRFGIPPDSGQLRKLGIEIDTGSRAKGPIRIIAKDSHFGFEQQPMPQIDSFIPLRTQTGTALLKTSDANGVMSDAAALTPWGGYILEPYVLAPAFGDQTAWVADPFRFFKDALQLPDMPVPDTTTENGVRLLLSHVDGDGFESMAEWPGGGMAADELRLKILEKYRLPVAVSVITGVVAPNGLYPVNSSRLEQAARNIFSLPTVEGASHSFSHPFRWHPDQEDSGEEVLSWHNLNIPGYKFNLGSEIAGSMKYINERLMPAGKKARLFLWTGNCVPGEDALRLAYQSGALNINGGDTLITGSSRSLTRVSPLGISRNGWFQVFAPNQNENVYTNRWSENFYGYRRVLETYRLTDLPRRLKPVDIYYHFYSATKEASMSALGQVHDWAVSQRLFSVFTSEYVEKVLDFNRTVVARDGSGWLVRNNGDIREFRIPVDAGYPDLSAGTGVAGFSEHGESRYIHVMPGGEARIRLSGTTPKVTYLARAGGRLESLERTGRGMKLTLRGYTPFTVALGGAAGCGISIPDGIKSSDGTDSNVYELSEGLHALVVDCK